MKRLISVLLTLAMLAAMIPAAVVFPVPGGPKNIMLGSLPVAAMRLSIPRSPTSSACPAISSKLSGRRRSAAGVFPIVAIFHTEKATAHARVRRAVTAAFFPFQIQITFSFR